MTPLRRAVIRDVGLRWRGQDLVVKVAQEGVYLKGRRQHWSGALLLPWAAAFDTAAKMRAEKQREERARRRKEARRR